ncbi:ArnT family glycosyltransferase [Pseudonocardia acaciae]|uniref:ArnT family glycosyltransferase n=1 Tax=Pseudonocardia acaciae TaxID=551276 RepID=UPI000A613265|nr:glycosyltransferase family 39 protein [Pseudonocardia acaciae]
MTAGRSAGESVAPLAVRPVLALAGAVGAVLLAVSWRYGYFGDELYLLAAGDHPDWAYADLPPLLPLLARAMDAVTGGSLVGLRLPAAVVTSAGVVVTALTARELGGARYAQVLAAAVYAGSAFTLGAGHLLSAPTVDAFLWAVCTWLLARWVRTRDDRLLLWLGLVTAVGLQARYLIAAFWAVVVVAVLTVGPRELGARPRLWLAGGFALVTAVPVLVWQARHGWPQLALNGRLAAEQEALGGASTFLPLVLVCAGIGAGALGACYGAARLLRAPELRPYAFLGWTAIGVTGLFVLADGRAYYVAGMFPVLWAAAAVEVERGRLPRLFRWVPRWPVLALSALLALPVLPVGPVSWLDHDRPLVGPSPRLGEVGWPELADTVADAYLTVPSSAWPGLVIVTENYREAAALDRFGPARGLPEVYSGHRGYWYFGSPRDDGSDAVLFVGDPSAIRPYFGAVRRLATVDTSALGARTPLDGTPIWLATDRRDSWARIWPALRHL